MEDIKSCKKPEGVQEGGIQSCVYQTAHCDFIFLRYTNTLTYLLTYLLTRMERAQEEDLRKQLADKRKEAEEKGEQCTWIIRRGKLVNQQRTERITQ